MLNSTIDPQEAREYFIIDDICVLVHKFYPQNFILKKFVKYCYFVPMTGDD